MYVILLHFYNPQFAHDYYWSINLISHNLFLKWKKMHMEYLSGCLAWYFLDFYYLIVIIISVSIILHYDSSTIMFQKLIEQIMVTKCSIYLKSSEMC